MGTTYYSYRYSASLTRPLYRCADFSHAPNASLVIARLHLRLPLRFLLYRVCLFCYRYICKKKKASNFGGDPYFKLPYFFAKNGVRKGKQKKKQQPMIIRCLTGVHSRYIGIICTWNFLKRFAWEAYKILSIHRAEQLSTHACWDVLPVIINITRARSVP